MCAVVSAADQKDRHHLRWFLPSWDSRFHPWHNSAQIGDRRPLRKGKRQSGYSTVSFVKYSQFTDSVLLHRWFHLRRRGMTVPRNSFACYYRQFLRILHTINAICLCYRRVRRPRRTACHPSAPCITVGAAIGRPHNGKPPCQFSIFNSQFGTKKNPKLSFRVL